MRQIADQYGGEIYVFGTPAEETWGSKVGMAKAGAFDDMDMVMINHPMDRDQLHEHHGPEILEVQIFRQNGPYRCRA